MSFTTVPDRAPGYALSAAGDWDVIQQNLNQGAIAVIEQLELTSQSDLYFQGADFLGIPQTFQHLMIVASIRSKTAALLDSCNLRFNGDFAGNYDGQYMYSNAGSSVAVQYFASSSIFTGECVGSTAPAGYFSTHYIFIPNYYRTDMDKTAIYRTSMTCYTTTTYCRIHTGAGWWRSTAAITDMSLGLGGTNFEPGTRAILLGLP